MNRWQRTVLFLLIVGGLALGIGIPAYQSVTKGVEYKVDAFWGQILGLAATSVLVVRLTAGKEGKTEDKPDDDDDKLPPGKHARKD